MTDLRRAALEALDDLAAVAPAMAANRRAALERDPSILTPEWVEALRSAARLLAK